MLLVVLVVAVAFDCEDSLGLQACYDLLVVDADTKCRDRFCALFLRCRHDHVPPTGADCPEASSCDSYCGFCAEKPLVRDCNGREAPSAWVGDGFCDDSFYLYNGALVDMNCDERSCDGTET